MIGWFRDFKVKILVGIDLKLIGGSNIKNFCCSVEKYEEEY